MGLGLGKYNPFKKGGALEGLGNDLQDFGHNILRPTLDPFGLLDKPETPSQPSSAQTALVNTASTNSPINVIYGSRKVGGSRSFTYESGPNNEYLHVIIVLGEGPISAINTVYLDDVPSTDARFTGFVTIEKHLGAFDQAASAALMADLPGVWTAAHQGKGIAYIYAKLTFNPSVFPRGLPVITADVDGRLCYNAATALTGFTHNPIWCKRDYLTNTLYGRGIDAALVDDAWMIAEAAYCDELVSTPAGNQARYTCDGVVNVNNTAYENTKLLATACRGQPVFSNGKYKVVIDRPRAVGMDFNPDNIIGSWSFHQPERKDKYNRVSATFYNPELNWQQDTAIMQSLTYTIEDGGRLSEHEIDLPFTSNYYRAQQIAMIELKKSRFGLITQFTAMPEGVRMEAGNVCSITHDTPAWTTKPFSVEYIEIHENDEVTLTCREYDPLIYTLDALAVKPSVGVSNLPNPFVAATPGAPQISETLYETTGSAGVKTKAIITCTPPPDAFVTNYHLDFKLASDPDWIEFPPQSNPYWEIFDVQPGTYQARVSSSNSMGVVSAYSGITSYNVAGLTAPPADMTVFNISKVGGVAIGSWNLTPDLDVKIGGRIIVRHTPLTTAATWADGYVVGEFPGDSVGGLLPLITGTYMIKARDSNEAGSNYSANMLPFIATEGMVTGLTTQGTSTQAPGFTGAKTNVSVAAGAMSLTNPAVSLTGSYAFDTYMDLGTVATRRFEADISAFQFESGLLIDAIATPIDSWGLFDGGVVNDCDVTLYAATTNDDPAGAPVWSAWTEFMVADFTCRAIKFKLDFVSGNTNHNISVSQLTVHAKA